MKYIPQENICITYWVRCELAYAFITIYLPIGNFSSVLHRFSIVKYTGRAFTTTDCSPSKEWYLFDFQLVGTSATHSIKSPYNGTHLNFNDCIRLRPETRRVQSGWHRKRNKEFSTVLQCACSEKPGLPAWRTALLMMRELPWHAANHRHYTTYYIKRKLERCMGGGQARKLCAT